LQPHLRIQPPQLLTSALDLCLKFLAVRAGLNQGYLSAGATLDLWVLRFDFATYSEEIGAYAGQREDRRYVAQITVGW